MSNSKNSTFLKITDHRTVPFNSTKTGTFSAAAGSVWVVGTATLFTEELQVGGWLVDLTNDEIRKIAGIGNNTSLNLVSGFTNALSLADVVYVGPSLARTIQIVVDNAAVTIDGSTTVANIPFIWDKASKDNSHKSLDFIDPVIVNATSHNAWILILE